MRDPSRRGPSRSALAALVVCLGVAASAPSAHAQAQPKLDKAAADQRAKDLFGKGDSAYAEGRYEEALASFQEAYTLSGRPQLLFNVSNALERLGRYGDAVDALEKYLASGKAKDRDVVQKRLANLKKRVEDQKKETDRLAREEEERRAKADAERKKPDSEPTGQPPPAAPAPPDKPAPVVPIILLVAGGAALATGGVFGVLTLSARSGVEDGCKDSAGGHLCSSDAGSAIDREKTFGLIADITVASGIVLAGVGAYLLLSGGKESARAQAIVNGPVRATAGPGGGGLQLVGSF